MKYHYTHILGQPKSETLTTRNTGKDVEQQERILFWGCKMVHRFGKQFHSKLNILLPYDPTIMLLGIYQKKLKTY